MPCFLMKTIIYFMAFHVVQTKHINFLYGLIYHAAATHAYVSPRPSWFMLGAVSALGHVVFISFQKSKWKEMKKIVGRKKKKLPKKVKN